MFIGKDPGHREPGGRNGRRGPFQSQRRRRLRHGPVRYPRTGRRPAGLPPARRGQGGLRDRCDHGHRHARRMPPMPGSTPPGLQNPQGQVGLNPDEDIARVQAIREPSRPDINLRIDANQGWSVPQAIYALRGMEKYKIQLVEQPWWPGTRRASRCPLREPDPIMADEAVFGPWPRTP